MFKAARCPNCSGELMLDPSLKSAFCMHCNSKIIVEEAIKKVQVEGIASLDNLFLLAEEEREAGNLEEAINYYKRVLELDPYHYKARFEKVLLDFEKLLLMDDLESRQINDRLYEVKKQIEFAFKNVPQNEREVLQQRKAMEIQESALKTFENTSKHFNQYRQNTADSLKKIFSSEDDRLHYKNLLSVEYDRYYKTLKDLIMKIELSSFCNPGLRVENNKMIVTFTEVFLKKDFDYSFPINNLRGKCEELGKIIRDKEEEILKHDSNYTTVGKRNRGCYIATVVYGSYDAPEVMVLRQYRDEVLSKSYIGQLFINAYYVLSPPLAERVKDLPGVYRLARFMLDSIVKRIE